MNKTAYLKKIKSVSEKLEKVDVSDEQSLWLLDVSLNNMETVLRGHTVAKMSYYDAYEEYAKSFND